MTYAYYYFIIFNMQCKGEKKKNSVQIAENKEILWIERHQKGNANENSDSL